VKKEKRTERRDGKKLEDWSRKT